MRDRGERGVKGRSPVERVKAHLFDGARDVRRRDLFVVMGVSRGGRGGRDVESSRYIVLRLIR